MKKGKLLFLLFVIGVFLPACKSEVPVKSEDISGNKETIIKNSSGDKAGFLINPAAICVDGRGNIFALEPEEKCVKKYSPEGKFLIRFGRGGDGPGELKSCFSIKIDEKDNIILYDEGREKLIKYTGDGKFVEESALSFYPENFYSTGGSGWYIEKTKEGTPLNGSGKLNILSLTSTEFKFIKNIDSCRIKDMKIITNPPLSIENPYYSKMLWGITGDKIWTVFTENYKVRIYSRDGILIREFTGKGEKARVTEADKKAYFESLHYTGSEGRSPLYSAPDWLVKGTDFPSYKPVIRGVLFDSNGSVMVNTSEEIEGKSVWDFYSADGTLIKRVLITKEVKDTKSHLRNGIIYTISRAGEGDVAVESYMVKAK